MFVKELDYFLKCVKNKNKTFNDITEGKKRYKLFWVLRNLHNSKKRLG
jgi:hypothetical protein